MTEFLKEETSPKRAELVKNAENAVNELLKHWKQEDIEHENKYYENQGSNIRVSYEDYPAMESFLIEVCSNGSVIFGSKLAKLKSELSITKEEMYYLKDELREDLEIGETLDMEIVRKIKELEKDEQELIEEIEIINQISLNLEQKSK